MSDVETDRSSVTGESWRPPPLNLVVCEPLEDEARRSVAHKSDAELAEMYAIASRAHAEASGRSDREGETDYWHVLQRALVEEALRRPSFGKGDPESDDSLSRRHRRRRRKLLDALAVACEAEQVDSR